MKFLLLTLCLLFTSCVTVLDCPPGVEYGDECTTHLVPAPYGAGSPLYLAKEALVYVLKQRQEARREARAAAEKEKAQLRNNATNFITVNKE